MAEVFVTIEEMKAELGGVNVSTVKRLINRGDLPPFDIGRNNGKVKAWHKKTLENHAARRQESFKTVSQPGQVVG